MRPIFAANTGFLWKELSFLERIKRAKEAGFDALEFHDEAQKEDFATLQALLNESALAVLAINTSGEGPMGHAANINKVKQARADIDDAINIATKINCLSIHVLSGLAEGAKAKDAYVASLRHALDSFASTIVIEPISHKSVAGYFLNNIHQAADIIDEVGNPRLKILFDCFHIQNDEGEVINTFNKYAQLIHHVQIASFPGRNEPDDQAINYEKLIPLFIKINHKNTFGCEYNPKTTVEEGLSWRDKY